jgi:hypothetical protein
MRAMQGSSPDEESPTVLIEHLEREVAELRRQAPEDGRASADN